MTNLKRGDHMAFRCQVDNGEAAWRLTRLGDVATSWACDEHLHAVARDLQRDWEVTQIVIEDQRKLREHGEIRRMLDDVAKGGAA